MKKLLAMLLALGLLLGLAACGVKDKDKDDKNKSEDRSDSPYMSAVVNVFDVNFMGEISEKKVEKLAPQEYWEYLEEERNLELKDVVERYEEVWEDKKEDYAQEYGDVWRVAYEVTSEMETSDSKLEKIADELHDKYDIAQSSVKSGYDMNIEMEIIGSEDDECQEFDFTVVKIDKKWYVLYCYTDDGEFYADFVV
jgi:hypothetical protein